MPSRESRQIRQTLQKEVVDASRSLKAERKDWDRYGARLPLVAGVHVETRTLGGVACAELRPEDASQRPVILYAHGGGLTAGSVLTHKAFAATLAEATRCTVLLPEYRLLPEHPVAAPSDDLLAVFKALEGQHVILGGDSSGAGLAITLMTRLRDAGCAMPAGCFCLSGAFDATLSGESMRTKDDVDPILSEEVLRHWQSHFPTGFAFDKPLISPLFADLRGLAPVLLLVGSDEVWLDDSTRLQSKLQAAGVLSKLRVFDGMWHVWPMTGEMPETHDALRQIRGFIDSLL